MARFQISNSVVINRPAEAVFHFVTDIPKATLWRPNLAIRDFSGAPFAVGTTWREVIRFLGREIAVKNEVTAVAAGQRCQWQADGGVVSGDLTWIFSQGGDDSCTVSLSFDGNISGWLASLASGLLQSQAQKDMKRDLANLKAVLESG